MVEKKEEIYSCLNCSYTQAFSLPIRLKAKTFFVPGRYVFPSKIGRGWCFDCDRITDCFTGDFEQFVYSDLPYSLRFDLEKALETWRLESSDSTLEKLKIRLQDEVISNNKSVFKFFKRKQRSIIKLLTICIEKLESINRRGNHEYYSKPKSPRCMECGNCNLKLEGPEGIPHTCGGFFESRVTDPYNGRPPKIHGEGFNIVLYDESGLVLERIKSGGRESVYSDLKEENRESVGLYQ